MTRQNNRNLLRPASQDSKNSWDIATKISAATLIATLVNIGVTSVLTWYSKEQDVTSKQQEARLKEMEIAMPLLRKDAADNYPQDVIAAASVKVRDYFSADYRPITGNDRLSKIVAKASSGDAKIEEPKRVKTISLKPCNDDANHVCPRN